jgi:hypothetical protein
MFALAVIAIGIFTLLSGGAAFFRMVEGRWPRYYFHLFMSSWYPNKQEDFATIIADEIDADKDCSKWKASWREFESLDGRYSFNHQHDTSGHIRVQVRVPAKYYDTVEASTWGDYRLHRAAKAWIKRNKVSKESRLNVELRQRRDKANEAVKKHFRSEKV